MTGSGMTTATTSAIVPGGLSLRLRMFASLMRREFLEHKTAFFTTPVVLGALMFGIIALTLVTLEVRFGEIMVHVDDAEFFVEDGIISIDGHEVGNELAHLVATAPSMLLLLILPFIIIFPMLGSLYEERRDRSYLFWKSMPVSDTEEVLAKLGFSAFVGPLLVFAFMAALGFATTLLATPFMWLHGLPAWDLLWSHFAFVSVWVGFAANYLVWALWAFPLFAWILLASAYAPKAPLMFAVLPPVVIGIIELIVLRSSHFFATIGQQLGGKFGMFIGHRIELRVDIRGGGGDHPTLADAAVGVGQALTSGSFWIGAAIGVAFIAGAIWLRRYNV
ncbi:MAG: ABC-2 transporter permease [Proteobacteria bacterium]|nr:ABC-2 transporter permease [Pseudomonadota bacterium]